MPVNLESLEAIVYQNQTYSVDPKLQDLTRKLTNNLMLALCSLLPLIVAAANLIDSASLGIGTFSFSAALVPTMFCYTLIVAGSAGLVIFGAGALQRSAQIRSRKIELRLRG